LVSEVRDVLTEAIAKGGSTLRDYVDAEGEPGLQLGYFVYAREGEPCRKCRTPIRHRRLAPALRSIVPTVAR
jgi:formamidopyrimidine-DNA glycosylase